MNRMRTALVMAACILMAASVCADAGTRGAGSSLTRAAPAACGKGKSRTLPMFNDGANALRARNIRSPGTHRLGLGRCVLRFVADCNDIARAFTRAEISRLGIDKESDRDQLGF